MLKRNHFSLIYVLVFLVLPLNITSNNFQELLLQNLIDRNWSHLLHSIAYLKKTWFLSTEIAHSFDPFMRTSHIDQRPQYRSQKDPIIFDHMIISSIDSLPERVTTDSLRLFKNSEKWLVSGNNNYSQNLHRIQKCNRRRVICFRWNR